MLHAVDCGLNLLRVWLSKWLRTILLVSTPHRNEFGDERCPWRWPRYSCVEFIKLFFVECVTLLTIKCATIIYIHNLWGPKLVVCSNFSAVINRIHCSVIMISSVNIISTYHSKRLAMFLCSTLDCCLIVAQKRARYNDNHCFGQQQGFFIPNSKFGSVQIDGERTMANVIVCIQ